MKKSIIVLITLILPLLFLQAQETSERGMKKKSLPDIQGVEVPLGERWALIIGIDKYAKLQPLRYAVKDAKAVRELLVDEYGYQPQRVFELYDEQATKENILEHFDVLKNKTVRDDQVFIFYAGHGHTEDLTKDKERGYILPVNGDLSKLALTAISTSQLDEYSERIPAKQLYLVLDACYGGQVFARSRASIPPESIEFVMAITKKTARKALTAGGRNEKVLDTGPGGHSVFTYYFLEALKTQEADKNRDKIITNSELKAYLQPIVVRESRRQQSPEDGELMGDEGGEFIFIPEARTFTYSISSDPPGAQILIDGGVQGTTPTNLDLEIGVHRLQFVKDGYREVTKELYVTKDNVERAVRMRLVRKYGTLLITSEPSGAILYIDGEVKGNTPYKGDLFAGFHTLTLKKETYDDHVRFVEITDNQPLEIHVSLERTMIPVTFLTEPLGASVVVEGKEIGVTPTDYALTIGEYEVVFKKSGYRDFKRKFTVSGEKKNEQFKATLQMRRGDMFIKSIPPKASVHVDGNFVGESPVKISDLQEGKHVILLEKKYYIPLYDTVEAKDLQLTEYPFVLRKDAEAINRVRAEIIYNGRVQLRNTARWSSVALSAGGMVVAYLLHNAANRAYDWYLNSVRPDDINAYYRMYEQRFLFRNIAAGSSVVFLASAVYFFWHEVDSKETIYFELMKKPLPLDDELFRSLEANFHVGMKIYF